MLERRKIKRDDLRALFKLKVGAGQDGLVARNEITIAQQGYEPGSAAWGLWDGKVAVGLLAMVHPKRTPYNEEGDDLDAAYIWRLMVGAEHQGKGFGRGAIEQACAVAREWELPRICLTFVDKDGGAEGFYLNCGFKRTGRVIDGEVEMIRDV